jgi:hypothetical protein
MNEFLVLFDTARGIAMVAFGVTMVVALGLAIFDGRKPARREDELEIAPERKAA